MAEVHLSTERSCHLIRIRKELIPNYYVLSFPKSQGEPTPIEITEMLVHGIEQAQQLAYDLLKDKEAFTVLYSGYSARREKGWHIHIILLGSRWRKAWLYFVLSFKNILQAFNLRKDDAPRLTK